MATSPTSSATGHAGLRDDESRGAAEPTHVIVPERTHHDEDQLELIAPVKLRGELDLADGDEVRVHVTDAVRADDLATANGAATEPGAADDGGSA